MNKLQLDRKKAEKMREALNQSETEPSFTEQEVSCPEGLMQIEFDKRLKAAIRRYKTNSTYKYTKLKEIINSTIYSVFTPNEATEAHWNYRRLFGHSADSTLTAIGYKPEFAKRFIKAFEEAVISEISK